MDISVNTVEMLMVENWKETFVIPWGLQVDFEAFNVGISSP